MSARAPSLSTESVRPPSGPLPVNRSGAIAMKPWEAISSATARIQSVSPKISWMTTTTGAVSDRSG